MRLAGAALAGVLLAGVSFAATPAAAQMESREGIALQNEILELQAQMQALQQGGRPIPAPRPDRGGSGGNGDLVAQLLDRVSALEDQVRQLRGEVDQLTNQQQRQAEDFKKQVADLTFAMQNNTAAAPSRPQAAGGGQVLSPPPTALGDQGGAPVAPQAQPPRTPEIAMQEGNAALARRDYPAAEAAAREVLGKRPRSPDAQFLLAQAEMGQRNYQQAAPDFYDAYNRSRTGPRAADALLGVANALIGLNDRASACDALVKLRSEFPQPRPDIRDGELAARQRAACR